MPKIVSLDHLVLTVRDIPACVRFYTEVLGVTVETFRPADGTERTALKFGQQKINLHQAGAEFEPKATTALPGTADLCFLTEAPLEDWQAHLAEHEVELMLGPVPRTGARGAIRSFYVRDPDGNLIEISIYD